MLVTFATWFVYALQLYAAIGVLFAIVFVIRGVGRVDPAAPGSSWGFRLMILPGSAAFWPLLLARWIRGTGPPAERSPHR